MAAIAVEQSALLPLEIIGHHQVGLVTPAGIPQLVPLASACSASSFSSGDSGTDDESDESPTKAVPYASFLPTTFLKPTGSSSPVTCASCALSRSASRSSTNSTGSPAKGGSGENTAVADAGLLQEVRVVLNRSHARLALSVGAGLEAVPENRSFGCERLDSEMRRLDESILTLVIADPAWFRRILNDIKQPCVGKQAVSRSCSLLAEASFASELLATGLLPALLQQLKCDNLGCQRNALQAIKALLLHGKPSNAAVQIKEKKKSSFSGSKFLRGMFAPKTLLGPSSIPADLAELKNCKRLVALLQDPSQPEDQIQLVLAIFRILCTHHSAANAVPSREALAAVLKLLHDRLDNVNKCRHSTSTAPARRIMAPRPPNMDLLCSALYTVHAILNQHGGSAAELTDEAVIEPLLQLLQVQDDKVTELTMMVLLHFVQASNQFKMMVVQRDGVLAAYRLLKRPNCMPSQPALQLLLSLAFHPPAKAFFLSAPIIPVLVNMVAKQRNIAAVIIAGQVIMELALGSQQCKVAAMAGKGLPVMLKLLESDDVDVHVVAVGVILAIVSGSFGARRAALQLHADRKLKAFALKTDDLIRAGFRKGKDLRPFFWKAATDRFKAAVDALDAANDVAMQLLDYYAILAS